MGILRYSINLTLDGCCDHQAAIPDEELHLHAAKNIAQADALIFGKVIYQMMESAWRIGDDGKMPDWISDWMIPFTESIHKAKKYVVSSTLKDVDWNAELIDAKNLKNTVENLKTQCPNGLFTGGVTLPLALSEMGLIDEYEFIIHPRITGNGPKLFSGMKNIVDLKLIDKKEFKSGAVALRYIFNKKLPH